MTPKISDVLEFLTSLYLNGQGYSACNTARSALSLILSPINGFPVGKHPLVVRILKGISKQRPPQPRYESVWDANIVLKLLKSWGSNSDLDIKRLSLKLVGLLALTSAQRVQTLCKLKVSNIQGTDKKQIVIDSQIKTSKISKAQPTIVLSPYNRDTNICVVKCVNEYLNRTSSYRKHDQLLISYAAPYNPVCSQTISRWLKMVLEEAGVDVSIFKAHSYRHASTSKAALKGVDMNVIFSKAGWTKGSLVFAKFYNRPIDYSYKFSDAVLNE